MFVNWIEAESKNESRFHLAKSYTAHCQSNHWISTKKEREITKETLVNQIIIRYYLRHFSLCLFVAFFFLLYRSIYSHYIYSCALTTSNLCLSRRSNAIPITNLINNSYAKIAWSFHKSLKFFETISKKLNWTKERGKSLALKCSRFNVQKSIIILLQLFVWFTPFNDGSGKNGGDTRIAISHPVLFLRKAHKTPETWQKYKQKSNNRW